MNLSEDVEIIVDVDDKDNNYCSEKCIYFMPNICDLPHITGGSDYNHRYDDKNGKYHRTDIGSREVYIKNEIMEKIVKIFEQCMNRVKGSASQYCTFCYSTLTYLVIDEKLVCTLKYENPDLDIFTPIEVNGCYNSICDSCADYEWGNDISFLNKKNILLKKMMKVYLFKI